MTQMLTRAFTQREYDLIKRTVAKDCDSSEFDMFMHICKHTGLDPLRRQIYAFVFDRDNPAKRQMVPVTAIGGWRSLAERTGNYRPDDQPPRITFDEGAKDENSNPLGIIKADVTVYKFAHGEWHSVAGEAHWEEYAPIKDGKLDYRKRGWITMPRVMIAKTAEAQALRRAWPDDFGALYEESELDRAQALDLSPSELAELGGQEKRLDKIGGPDAIMIDWLDGSAIDRVLIENAAERIDEFITENEDAPNTIAAFQDRNKHALQEFWARNPSDALEIKKCFEQVANATA